MRLNDLLLESQRVSGTRKPITIVNPAFYNQFFEWLRDSHIRIQYKAFFAVCLSGGLRVTEGLSLRRRDLDKDGFFTVRVLKKKRELQRTKVVDGEPHAYFLKTNKVYRDAKLHPIALEILTEYIAAFNIGYHDRLFTFDRRTALNQTKDHFGKNACNHMFRHSHFSWELESLPAHKVAKNMEVKLSNVENYTHVDKRASLNKLYGSN